MKRYCIIFTRDSKVLLSTKKYKDWKEIQDIYDNYMTSLDFDTLDEISDYLIAEYKLSREKAISIVKSINGLGNKTIELSTN